MMFCKAWLSGIIFVRSLFTVEILLQKGESRVPVAVVFIKNIVIVFLTAVQFAMLIRAIMSWFPMNSNKFTDFIYSVTEPFIYPIRMLFDKMNWFVGLPIDISFLVSYLLISLILVFLP